MIASRAPAGERMVETGRGTQIMNVAAVTMDNNNAVYRVRLPLLAMQHLGHGIYEERGATIRRPDLLLGSDVVLFYRHWNAPARAMARRLRGAGVGVVFDNDDDVTSIPKDVPGYQRSGGPRAHAILTEMRGMMNEAHVVTTTTEALAQRFRELTATEVRPIDNYVPPDWFVETSRRADLRIVVGWMAGNEHQADYQRLRLRSVFERLLDEHPNVRLVSIGLGLGLASARYTHIKTVAFADLTAACARFDLGIAPLADIPFNRYRSAVKLKEYASAGIPWLASHAGPYRGLGPAQGGHVIDNDDWYGALDRLVRDAGERRRLAEQGRLWVRRETIDVHALRWHEAFADGVERAGRARPPLPRAAARPRRTAAPTIPPVRVAIRGS